MNLVPARTYIFACLNQLGYRCHRKIGRERDRKKEREREIEEVKEKERDREIERREKE